METMVSELIDVESRAWKTNMIRDVFLEREANSILSIPLSTTLPADRLVWTAAANEKFCVNSAYHLERNRDRNGGGESSNRLGKGSLVPLQSEQYGRRSRGFYGHFVAVCAEPKYCLKLNGYDTDDCLEYMAQQK
ncbi:hypothetical protein SO802_025710 [Lithocarpus litseifolius]|uniref:Uncharacterized protein n=1 Tax=Lithocarpus litseifolius TaxID=425828 RepID=A0AAW2BXF8_9ROSI